MTFAAGISTNYSVDFEVANVGLDVCSTVSHEDVKHTSNKVVVVRASSSVGQAILQSGTAVDKTVGFVESNLFHTVEVLHGI